LKNKYGFVSMVKISLKRMPRHHNLKAAKLKVPKANISSEVRDRLKEFRDVIKREVEKYLKR